tara:strand:+ start:433 stop:543 length:111 start_codon:yes stop_codon:yes gene_type:complete
MGVLIKNDLGIRAKKAIIIWGLGQKSNHDLGFSIIA